MYQIFRNSPCLNDYKEFGFFYLGTVNFDLLSLSYDLLIAILCNHQPKFGTHGHGF